LSKYVHIFLNNTAPRVKKTCRSFEKFWQIFMSARVAKGY
jgi:hypothetical protein